MHRQYDMFLFLQFMYVICCLGGCFSQFIKKKEKNMSRVNNKEPTLNKLTSQRKLLMQRELETLKPVHKTWILHTISMDSIYIILAHNPQRFTKFVKRTMHDLYSCTLIL